ncbi:hypothetical protein QBC34DRAFT_85915 [Podospora aff. communis PSN243]|uniref:Uncharacterized protein n=1 Tax=Podospora aff. communis PSN243 TaxID=3040156 RepID=A0AAV9GR56_9PEZI|nr:hypothetical protein QBC34DRAFT_85915 [Podospora aff. communis PSN243]
MADAWLDGSIPLGLGLRLSVIQHSADRPVQTTLRRKFGREKTLQNTQTTAIPSRSMKSHLIDHPLHHTQASHRSSHGCRIPQCVLNRHLHVPQPGQSFGTQEGRTADPTLPCLISRHQPALFASQRDGTWVSAEQDQTTRFTERHQGFPARLQLGKLLTLQSERTSTSWPCCVLTAGQPGSRALATDKKRRTMRGSFPIPPQLSI